MKGISKQCNNQRVLVVGLDGATLDLVSPWVREGYLPSFARIMNEGIHGELASTVPPMTGPAWSSFATGKNPGKHGIYDFVVREPGSYELRIENPGLEGCEPLWRILSRAGKKVVFINLPITHKPEKVNGVMVTGMLTPARAEYTYPKELAQELDKAVGGYEILPSGVLHPRGREEEHLACVQRETEMRIRATDWLMTHYDWDFFMVVFGGTDQVQHALWHAMDNGHQWHDPSAPRSMKEGILAVYQQMDNYIGDLLGKIGNETLLMIMSDHGFGPLEYYIHPNTWLMTQGFLRLRRSLGTRFRHLLFRLGLTPGSLYYHGLTPPNVSRVMAFLGFGTKRIRGLLSRSKGTEQFFKRFFLSFSDVNWKQTKAYSLGNVGPIYLNVAGREPNGIVRPGHEYEILLQRLIRLLYGLEDPRTEQPIVEKVYRREELYRGVHVTRAPDLFFMPKDLRYAAYGDYEFSSNQVVERCFDRTGGHRMNGLLMMRGPGVRRGVRLGGAEIVDLAPTILAVMGIPIPKDMDGKILQEAFSNEFLRQQAISYIDTPAMPGTDTSELSKEEEDDIKARLRGLGYL